MFVFRTKENIFFMFEFKKKNKTKNDELFCHMLNSTLDKKQI